MTKLYHIHYQFGPFVGHFAGVYDEETKDFWLAHLTSPRNSNGVRYWAEPVDKPEGESDDDRALETAKRLNHK